MEGPLFYIQQEEVRFFLGGTFEFTRYIIYLCIVINSIKMNKCLECGKEISKKGNTFCNRSCSVSFNNRKSPKRIKTIKACKNCGKVMNKTQNSFCNKECFQEHTFKKVTLPRFYKGEILWNNTIRKVLTYLYGDKCNKCGIGPVWNSKPLTIEVDHIDGNSDNCAPDNLRLLCPNCHSQEDTSAGGLPNKKSTKRNKYLRKYKNSGYIE